MRYNYFHYPDQKLPSYGSVMYFAYLKLSDEKKEILYLLDQLKSQIISCTELYDNIQVANQKTNWWLKEINNLKSSKNISSPQLKKLVKIFDSNLLYQKLIEDISYSIDNSSATQRDFNKHVAKNFLNIETLKFLYLNEFAAIDKEKIRQININNETVRHIFCIAKHFYNQITFNSKITSDMSREDFKQTTSQWLENFQKLKLSKNLKSLEKINKIHYSMVKKYLKKIKNPFKEVLHYSPLNLLCYSITINCSIFS